MAHSQAVRAEAVQRMMLGETISSISRELGVSRLTLRQWREVFVPAVEREVLKQDAEERRLAALAQVNAVTSLVTDELPLGDRVVRELERIAMGNVSDVMHWDAAGNGTFVPSAELTPDQAAVIGGVKIHRSERFGRDGELVGVETRMELKANSKVAALGILARITGQDSNGEDGAAGGVKIGTMVVYFDGGPQSERPAPRDVN